MHDFLISLVMLLAAILSVTDKILAEKAQRYAFHNSYAHSNSRMSQRVCFRRGELLLASARGVRNGRQHPPTHGCQLHRCHHLPHEPTGTWKLVDLDEHSSSLEVQRETTAGVQRITTETTN
jgi:hypothetical protein